MSIFIKRSRLSSSPAKTWLWHCAPGALELLTPPSEPVTIVARDGDGIADGSRVTLRIGRRPFRLTWVAEHRDVVPGKRFSDVMVQGPFAAWKHEHRFEDDGAGGTILVDRIEYRLPFGWFGRLLLGRFIRRRLERLFAFRHQVTARALGSPEGHPPLPGGRLLPLDDEGRLVWIHQEGVESGTLHEVLGVAERLRTRRAG